MAIREIILRIAYYLSLSISFGAQNDIDFINKRILIASTCILTVWEITVFKIYTQHDFEEYNDMNVWICLSNEWSLGWDIIKTWME